MKTLHKFGAGIALALALSFPLSLGLTGCMTAPAGGSAATLAPAIKVAAAIDQVASSLATAQQVEISLHEQGFIDAPTHIAIQKGFLKVGLDGAAITKGVNDGISATSMQALVAVLTADLQADVQSGALGIKNANSQATFSASIATISVAVQLIMQSYQPPAAPVTVIVAKP